MKYLLSTLLFVLTPFTLHAETLAVGQALPTVQLVTQHDKTASLKTDTQLILFSADKASSDLLKETLKGKDQQYLDQHNIQIVADISAMPALITKMFAMPKLRKRPYDLLLAKDEAQLSMLPRKEKAITVIAAENGKVTSIDHVDDGKVLLKQLP